MEIIYGYICCFFCFVLHCIVSAFQYHTIRCDAMSVTVFCCVRLHRNNVIGISSTRNRQYHKIMMHRHQTPHFVRFAYSIAQRDKLKMHSKEDTTSSRFVRKLQIDRRYCEHLALCEDKLISKTKNCLDGKNKLREWKTVRAVAHFEWISWKSLLHECKVVGTTSKTFCTKHIQAASASEQILGIPNRNAHKWIIGFVIQNLCIFGELDKGDCIDSGRWEVTFLSRVCFALLMNNVRHANQMIPCDGRWTGKGAGVDCYHCTWIHDSTEERTNKCVFCVCDLLHRYTFIRL